MTETPTYGYENCRVTGVILARNEAKTIREVVKLTAEHVQEVIVMDGHSTDRTVEIARDAGAKVFADPGNGKGSAIRQSLTLTDADVVVFVDADGSHDPADIPRLVEPVARNETDLCIGSRFTGGSEELSVSVGQLIRTIGNICMNIAINKRWKVNLTDTLNGFRAIRREAALQLGLTENRHTIEQEMVMKVLRYGYRTMNVPTHEYDRKFGVSHINIWWEWPMFFWCMVVNLAPRDKARSSR